MITTLETTHHLDLQPSSETAPASIQNRHKSRLSEAFAPLESGLRDSIWAAHAIGLAVFMAMVTVFVLWGATRLEVGSQEARLAMAAREPLGPVGQSFGGLDPAIYPGPLVAIKAWVHTQRGSATTASNREALLGIAAAVAKGAQDGA